MKRLLDILVVGSVFAVAIARAAPPGMTEIDEIVAKVQIQELIYRYALMHNTDDPEGYAGLFTEDADLMGTVGRAAIRAMAERDVERLAAFGVSVEGDHRFGFLRTHVMNPLIEITDATHATGIAYVQVVVPDVANGNIPTIFFEGTYQDEFRKVNGQWLISKRRTYGGLNYAALGARLGLGGGAEDEDD